MPLCIAYKHHPLRTNKKWAGPCKYSLELIATQLLKGIKMDWYTIQRDDSRKKGQHFPSCDK